MPQGAVLMDGAMDLGGCFQTLRVTTHLDPIYEIDGIVDYCVANMPGAAAHPPRRRWQRDHAASAGAG